MKKFVSQKNEHGERKKVPKDLVKKFNLNYLGLTNKTYAVGEYDLPEVICNTSVYPDYIAGYSNPGNYHKTPNTAVAYYQFDDSFDGIHGLYNAIYYKNESLLKKFKERFSGVKIFIAPDYSELGDIDPIENHYRARKARIVSLWLSLELGAVVIPNITYSTVEDIGFYLKGLERCTVVAFSTMCYAENKIEKKYLIEAVHRTVDYLNLKAIVVFDVCSDSHAVDEIFAYAREKGVDIIVPQNMMKCRNTARKKVV